jgi:hypothetical protein
MKKAITISNILSWINLIISGVLALFALISMLVYPGIQFLISAVLIGCITLHSYAALQLRKSILNPHIPLNKQTPVGIRIMGYMALFFAVILFSQSVYMMQHTQELLKQAQFPPQMKNVDVKSFVRGTGIFMLIFSVSVILNVILNLRFLKLYTLMQNSEPK